MAAAAAGNIEAVDEVNREDQYGRTQLYIACQQGHVDAARLLLDNGAEVDPATKKGTTPLAIAEERGHSSIVALLEAPIWRPSPGRRRARRRNT